MAMGVDPWWPQGKGMDKAMVLFRHCTVLHTKGCETPLSKIIQCLLWSFVSLTLHWIQVEQQIIVTMTTRNKTCRRARCKCQASLVGDEESAKLVSIMSILPTTGSEKHRILDPRTRARDIFHWRKSATVLWLQLRMAVCDIVYFS
jgi:hypothetical protein